MVNYLPPSIFLALFSISNFLFIYHLVQVSNAPFAFVWRSFQYVSLRKVIEMLSLY